MIVSNLAINLITLSPLLSRYGNGGDTSTSTKPKVSREQLVKMEKGVFENYLNEVLDSKNFLIIKKFTKILIPQKQNINPTLKSLLFYFTEGSPIKKFKHYVFINIRKAILTHKFFKEVVKVFPSIGEEIQSIYKDVKVNFDFSESLTSFTHKNKWLSEEAFYRLGKLRKISVPKLQKNVKLKTTLDSGKFFEMYQNYLKELRKNIDLENFNNYKSENFDEFEQKIRIKLLFNYHQYTNSQKQVFRAFCLSGDEEVYNNIIKVIKSSDQDLESLFKDLLIEYHDNEKISPPPSN